MRALTVRQPWASLIVAGVKPVENRTWPYSMPRDFPHHLAIHAAKADTDNDPTIPRYAWDALGLLIGGAAPLRGVLIGYVTITGCHHANGCHPEYIDYCSAWAEPDTYHWTLAGPVALDEPIPMRGRQGLWTVPDDVLAGVPA